LIVSKIERAEADSGAVKKFSMRPMRSWCAPRDLAVEVGDAVVPALQKRMIRMARGSRN